MQEEKNIGPADMNPSDPDTTTDTRRGEEVSSEEGTEPGRQSNVGTKGESERPYGTSDVRDSTGVDSGASESQTGGPSQPAGDQAG